MNILVATGMWPPDVGGPASHAPEVCEYLLSRGHRVAAVTMADRAPAPDIVAITELIASSAVEDACGGLVK